jgi:NADH-quinone oxidoreductase subunit J
VVSHDLVHSVLWLGLTLVATAGLFVTLHAEFLAAVQILLYTGGVITLMLFGVMLTRRLTSARIEHGSTKRLRGAVLAVAAFAVITVGIVRGGSLTAPPRPPGDTKALGELVLTRLVLPFEVLSVLLLAAMIGAIVLARKVDQ